MSRFVRLVQIIPASEGQEQTLHARAAALPPDVTVALVPTGAGLQVTLTTRYRRLPGCHRRAVRTLRKGLNTVLSG